MDGGAIGTDFGAAGDTVGLWAVTDTCLGAVTGAGLGGVTDTGLGAVTGAGLANPATETGLGLRFGGAGGGFKPGAAGVGALVSVERTGLWGATGGTAAV